MVFTHMHESDCLKMSRNTLYRPMYGTDWTPLPAGFVLPGLGFPVPVPGGPAHPAAGAFMWKPNAEEWRPSGTQHHAATQDFRQLFTAAEPETTLGGAPQQIASQEDIDQASDVEELFQALDDQHQAATQDFRLPDTALEPETTLGGAPQQIASQEDIDQASDVEGLFQDLRPFYEGPRERSPHDEAVRNAFDDHLRFQRVSYYQWQQRSLFFTKFALPNATAGSPPAVRKPMLYLSEFQYFEEGSFLFRRAKGKAEMEWERENARGPYTEYLQRRYAYEVARHTRAQMRNAIANSADPHPPADDGAPGHSIATPTPLSSKAQGKRKVVVDPEASNGGDIPMRENGVDDTSKGKGKAPQQQENTEGPVSSADDGAPGPSGYNNSWTRRGSDVHQSDTVSISDEEAE